MAIKFPALFVFAVLALGLSACSDPKVLVETASIEDSVNAAPAGPLLVVQRVGYRGWGADTACGLIVRDSYGVQHVWVADIDTKQSAYCEFRESSDLRDGDIPYALILNQDIARLAKETETRAIALRALADSICNTKGCR